MYTQEHDSPDDGGDVAYFTQSEYESIMALRARYLLEHPPMPLDAPETATYTLLVYGLGFITGVCALVCLWAALSMLWR